MTSVSDDIDWKWHGTIDYRDALEIQLKTLDFVRNGGKDQLILLEHPPVYTFGKSADHNNLLANEHLLANIGASVYETKRGGDITFHGPGQLVGYPIINLNRLKIGARKYVDILEEAVIELISNFNLSGYRIDGLTGIWVRSKDGHENKIGAIGIKISHGVTMHGFALNLNTDLNYFSYINPCGILDKGVTSVQKETGLPVDIEATAGAFSKIFHASLLKETALTER